VRLPASIPVAVLTVLGVVVGAWRSADGGLAASGGYASPRLGTDGGASPQSGDSTTPAPEPVAEVPTEPFELVVDGYASAVVVPPQSATPPPWRLIVVLHGNFDRPEWECDTWSRVARARGWLLCTRGVPRDDADPALERWTYRTAREVGKEAAAAAAALRAVHPGLVADEGAILIGFSLGAHMAWKVAAAGYAPIFEHLVFGEGGWFVTEDVAQRAVDRGVRRVLFLCGDQTRCVDSLPQPERIWSRAGADVERIVMPDTGHAYAVDFQPFAEEIFALLLAE